VSRRRRRCTVAYVLVQT